MSLYKFDKNDILRNVIKTHPQSEFFIYNSKIYINNEMNISGAFTGSQFGAPTGFVSLYEYNVDRKETSTGRVIGTDAAPDTGLIYPFVVKNSSHTSFKTMTDEEYASKPYGSYLSGSYRLTSSIRRKYFPANHLTSLGAQNASKFIENTSLASLAEHAFNIKGTISGSEISALKQTLNFYTRLSPHYAYSSSFGDKSLQVVNLISIPSIVYGSSIKKGTVDLRFYITGTLVGRLQDTRQNGELIETTGSSVDSIAGVVLYNEGFLLLTGSWNMGSTSNSIDFIGNNVSGDKSQAKWIYFGVGAQDSTASADSGGSLAPSRASASCLTTFQGTHYVPTLTMFAHAKKGHLNHSNNPTYIKYGQNTTFTSGTYFYKEAELDIKNVVSSSYSAVTASFAKHTYISQVGIYDEQKRLIAVANVSKPVKKIEERDFTFKLKIDL